MSDAGSDECRVLTRVEEVSLEEFKLLVKKWVEIDSYCKKLTDALREKKQQKDKLSETITKFMCKYNIEDLNTKDGRIRCKTSVVRAPVSQKEIQSQIIALAPNGSEIVQKIFEGREKKEKVCLRRLKIT